MITEQEIENFNESCAEFMGFIPKQYRPDDTDIIWCDYKTGLPVGELLFHSDWNWIMEVRYKILSINSNSDVGQRYTFSLNATSKFKLNDLDKPFKVRIKGNVQPYPRPNINVESHDEKDAVITAIREFIIWYRITNNNNK